jgi:hypothetical protein
MYICILFVGSICITEEEPVLSRSPVSEVRRDENVEYSSSTNVFLKEKFPEHINWGEEENAEVQKKEKRDRKNCPTLKKQPLTRKRCRKEEEKENSNSEPDVILLEV